jgi:site-specific DNA-methyltransferase (adenine-specific)
MWLFTTGFPKSVDVAKAIDAAHGVKPEVVTIRGTKAVSLTDGGYSKRVPDVVTAAVTEEAKQWEGWGTALKPAFEPIVLARKPLEGTLVDNIRKWGTGGLNVDACRIGTSKRVPTSPCRSGMQGPSYGNLRKHTGMTSGFDPNTGRWPTNVVFNDDDVAALLEEQKPGISRFFYCPKVSRKERDVGCETLPDRTARETVERNPTSPGARNPRAGAGRGADASMPVKNHHPTVKPVALMEWLVRLVTPPSGIVLDPFAGSGSTGLACQRVGVRFLGIEKEAEYVTIAKARLKLG